VNKEMPAGITVATPVPTEIVIKGADRQRVGQIAAEHNQRDGNADQDSGGDGQADCDRLAPEEGAALFHLEDHVERVHERAHAGRGGKQGNEDAETELAAAAGIQGVLHRPLHQVGSRRRHSAGDVVRKVIPHGRTRPGEQSQQGHQEHKQRENGKEEVVGQFGGTAEHVVVVGFVPYAGAELPYRQAAKF
jgi:hypothetical protein